MKHRVVDGDGSEAPIEPGREDRDVVEELAGYVAPFVAMIPSPYREALTLVELEGLAHKEAADMLGTSLSCMKSRVQRGRARLRKALEDCCYIALDARGRVVSCEPRPNGGSSQTRGACRLQHGDHEPRDVPGWTSRVRRSMSLHDPLQVLDTCDQVAGVLK